MPSPFDQDNQPTVPSASEWPTQPEWPAPPQQAAPAPYPAPPAPPTQAAPTPAAPASVWQPAPAAPPVWQAQPVGPPMGPPPVPPAVGYAQPQPAPAPRRSGWTSSGSRVGLAVALVLALVVGAAGGGVAARSILTTSADTATAPPVAGSGGTTATVPSQGSSGSSGSSSGSSGSGSGSSSGSSNGSSTQLSSWDEVSAKVNVGVVDIESRMSGGVGAGTGMVLTADGEILTNNHVVEGASQIVVTVVTTGESYRASIVGTDPEDDVAVLQLTGASGLETIPLGDSDTVQVGDQVAAIGNAGGVGGTPSIATGRVTALGQQITASDEDGSNAETLTDMIQVDANVVPGDSGGPLANTSGEVIGMDSAAAASNGSLGATRFRGGTGGGEGYAIPINKALSIAEELKRTHANAGSSSGTSTSGGYLGVQVQESADGGAEIVSVQSGSPAAQAGLAAGATIVAIDRTEITTPDQLVSALSGHAAGDKVTITWLGTDGRSHQTSVTLASR